MIFFRALEWYKKAADLGDKRAIQRLKTPQGGPMYQPGKPDAVLRRDGGDSTIVGAGKNRDKECVIM